jgi:hypothetical protein
MPTVAPSFVDFAERVLGVVFEGGQRTFWRVAADGVDPIDLDPGERAIARELFGNVDRIPRAARKVVVALKGADTGFTWLLALRFVHRCLTARIDDAAAGEVRWCIAMAPDLDLSREIISYARGAIESNPALVHMLVSSTLDAIVLARPDGREVGIKSRAAAVGGRGGRGKRWIEGALDEVSFFRDKETGAVNDEDCYRPIAARVRDGQVWVGSTPWAESGLLHSLYSSNWEKPRTALAARLPTVAMRTDRHVLDNVERESERDPDSAAREFGCAFLSAGSSQFFDDASLNACIDDELVLPAIAGGGAVVHAGFDAGYTRNSSALAIVARTGDLVRLIELEEMRPKAGEPLKPSKVGRAFRDRVQEYRGCDSVACDGHYVESNREHFAPVRLVEAPSGQNGKAVVFLATRSAMREGRVRLPNDPRLLKQLRQVVSKALPGGGMAISSPVWRGGEHGDLVSAVVLAIWKATKRGAGMSAAESMAELQRVDDEVYGEGDAYQDALAMARMGLARAPLDEDEFEDR